MDQTPAQKHADLVDRVLALPGVKAEIEKGWPIGVCPACGSLFKSVSQSDRLLVHGRCFGRLNFSNESVGQARTIEAADDAHLEEILKQLAPAG